MSRDNDLVITANTNIRGILLYDLFDLYLDTITNKNTLYSTKNIIKNFKSYFSNKNICYITASEIQIFINYYKHKNIEDITLYHYYRVLKSIFNFAINNNYLIKNPCNNLKIKHVYKKDRFINYSKKYLKELLKLFKNSNIYLCVLIALHTRHASF